MFQGWKVQTQKITTTMNISSKNLFTKSYLSCAYYINFVEAIIKHQKLRLTYRDSRSSSMACKNYRELLTL